MIGIVTHSKPQYCFQSHGCSGAEAVAICQEAALFAMEEDIHIESVKHVYYFKKNLNCLNLYY